MSCAPTYHETQLSTLFGSVLTPSTTEVICVPDAQDSCDGLFDCAVNAFENVKGGDVLVGTVQSVGELAAFYSSGGLSVLGTVLEGVATAEQIPELAQASAVLGLAETAYTLGSNLEASTMGIFDGFDWDFGSVVDFTSDIIDDVPWSDVIDFGGTAFQTYNQFAQPVANRNVPAPRPGTGQGGILGPLLKSGPTVGRSFFNKWPNLATAIQKMRNAGQNVSRSKLYSMLKRFGPDFLISAGILTAAAVSELALAGPGHRRMNPANSKALRRATRRIKSFHRLCGDADVIKSRRRSCAKRC